MTFCMNWRQRLIELTLAGGSVVAASCGGPISVVCGNGNPDPCICDRPLESAQAAEECNAKTACEAKGGTWQYSPADTCALPLPLPDAGVTDGH